MSRPVRPLRSVAAIAALALLLAACSGGGDDDAGGDPTTTTSSTTEATTTTAPGTGPTPQPTLQAAVEGLLDAEVDADPAASFRFLGAPARETYHDVAEWTTRRSQLPQTTGYEIEEADDPDTVVAVVTHPPGLDPFIGLSPARERQTWSGVEVDEGWLVAGEPEVEFLLPPEDGIAPAVQSWAQAVQACDQEAGSQLEAADDVLGTSVGASELCGSTGAVSVGEVQPLEAGPQSTDLIAQYSTDVLDWARVVAVTGPVTDFSAVVAPIGDEWRVLAVSD